MKKTILFFLSLFLIIFPLTSLAEELDSNIISTENIELYEEPRITRVRIEFQGGRPTSVREGEQITLISIIEGTHIEDTNVTYQWQINTNDPNNDNYWIDIENATSNTYTFAASAATIGAYYRVVIYWEVN